MSAIKKLAGQTAVYGLSTIAGRFLNYLLVPLFTRVFTQAEFGINSEFYAYISFLNIILTHGMESTFFRFAEKNQSKQVFANALISVVGLTSIFSAIFLVYGQGLATWIGYGNHPEYLYFSVGILFFDSLCAIPFALLRLENKLLRFAVIKNINILINIGLNLYFLLLCPYYKNTWGVDLPFSFQDLGISKVFMANLIASGITALLLAKEIMGISFGFHFAQWKTMMVYAIPMVFVGLAGMVNETLDRALLRYLWPNTEEANAMNGIYAANYKLSIIITLFIQAYKFAAEPFFFSHSKTTENRDLYAKVMNYFIWICLFVFLLVMLFIDVFKHFIDIKFHSGLGVVPILLFANIFLGIYYNLSIWYKLTDKTQKGAQISGLGAFITIALNVILIPRFGYFGCAWTTFICYLFMMVLGYVWGQKYYPIPYNINRALLYLVAALALFFISKIIQIDTSVFRFIIHLLLLATFILIGYLIEIKNLTLKKI